jgi:hypothetical protein
MNVLKLVEDAESVGYEAWEAEADPVLAFKELLKRPEPILLVAGSFFLLNHIRPLILKK